jgi:hypothetical protein
MAAASDIVRTVGDRQLAIRGAFKRRVNGTTTPMDLTGATITFRMVEALAPHSVVVNWSAAVIQDAAEGLVYYAPTAGDVDTEGTYLAYFRSSLGGLDLTLPTAGFQVQLVAAK